MQHQEIPETIKQAIQTMIAPYGDWDIFHKPQSHQRENNKYLSAKEAIAYIGNISRTTLYRIVKDGEIPVIEIGSRIVFDPVDLDKFLKRKKKVYKKPRSKSKILN